MAGLLQDAFGPEAPAVEVRSLLFGLYDLRFVAGRGVHRCSFGNILTVALLATTMETCILSISLARLFASKYKWNLYFNLQVYDGDTSAADRPIIRQTARLLITNPDMLHLSVLPAHKEFARVLAGLRYVVLDEGHAYQGVFGCHTALVIRRLRR